MIIFKRSRQFRIQQLPSSRFLLNLGLMPSTHQITNIELNLRSLLATLRLDTDLPHFEVFSEAHKGQTVDGWRFVLKDVDCAGKDTLGISNVSFFLIVTDYE